MKSFAVENLACERGGRGIFAGVSFALSSGGALAVTGANGAGKSSLLRLCAGLMRPAAGRVLADGAGAHAETCAHALHYIGHADALKPGLSALENLRVLTALTGAAARDEDLRAALAQTGAESFAHAPARALSAGQRRRAALARLAAAARPLWLLDEPAAALDADGAALLNRMIEKHISGGGMVIAATHTGLPGADAQQLRLGDSA